MNGLMFALRLPILGCGYMKNSIYCCDAGNKVLPDAKVLKGVWAVG